MAAIEQAIGVSELFEADGKTMLSNERLLNLHTRLSAKAEAFAELVNKREHDNAQP